ncbi:MAG TPA: TetR/AcrR family transcriptional regulator [Stellaceae bacterium]|nr:TetR/AcrR family transcriptional regulator [Stellaceae bacterium]
MAAAAKRAADPRPDPRIARSRQVILAAALEELGDAGYGAFTIESVAARAGVGKATIYRHWPDKLALIADAFRQLQEERDPELVTGTPREKLKRILRHVADVAADSPFGVCLPALIDAAERDPAIRRFHHRFQAEARKPTVALIAAGIASGDFPPHLDAELAAQALLGAVFFRRLMTDKPFDPAEAGALIATVMGPR